jgi:NADH:ubiquinone oxidoreductase subunit 6 (subunit J)
MAQSSQNLQLAAVAVPILALVITVAIDSVEKNDSPLYRGLIGGLSALTLASALVVILLASLSAILPVPSVDVITNLIYVSILVAILTFIVILKETLRGTEEDERVRTLGFLVLITLGGTIVLLLLP